LLAVGLSLFAGSIMGIFLLVVLGGVKSAMHRYYGSLKNYLYTQNLNVSYIPPPSDEAAAVKFPYASAICVGTIAAMWYLSMFSGLTKQLAGF